MAAEPKPTPVATEEVAAKPEPKPEPAVTAKVAVAEPVQPHTHVAYKSKASAAMAKPAMPDMPAETVTPQAMSNENREAVVTSGKTAGATNARSKSHAPMTKPQMD